MPSEEDFPVIKIMIVDDDPAIGDLIADFLVRGGHRPVICTHPQQALDLIKKEPFHLAFIDINMPVMDGLELTTSLKKENPLLEVVFITGFGTFDNAIQAIKVGAYDYLRKPFGINELSLCIKRFQERMELKERTWPRPRGKGRRCTYPVGTTRSTCGSFAARAANWSSGSRERAQGAGNRSRTWSTRSRRSRRRHP